MKNGYVYIMSNKPNGVLYVGTTDDIDARVQEHKTKVFRKSFTARYNCDNWFILKYTNPEEKPQNGKSK